MLTEQHSNTEVVRPQTCEALVVGGQVSLVPANVEPTNLEKRPPQLCLTAGARLAASYPVSTVQDALPTLQ